MNLNISIDDTYYKSDSIEHGRVIRRFLDELMQRVYLKAYRYWQAQMELTGNPDMPLLYKERNLYSIFASAIDEITPVHLSEWSFNKDDTGEDANRRVDFWCLHANGENGKALNFFIELKKNYYCLSEGTQEDFAKGAAAAVTEINDQVVNLKRIAPDWDGDDNAFLGIVVTHGYYSPKKEPAYDETHIRDNIYKLLNKRNTPQMLFSTWTLPKNKDIQWEYSKCEFVSMSAIAITKRRS